MNEYVLKDSTGYSSGYIEPSVSYFDNILVAGEKTVSALALSAAAVATALVSCACTAIRAAANCLKE